MELLTALARNKHFARAAAECGISQPAFSARIRNLEEALGVPIVMRGNRFLGFTQEGEIAVRWARTMSADIRGLRQEIEQARGVLSGNLTIGSIPTTLTFAATVSARLQRKYPELSIQIYSHSASEIAEGMQNFSFDAGITYEEKALPSGCRSMKVMDERYELLVPSSLADGRRDKISWQDAASFPLCLLTRNMLNRKIVDDAFGAAKAVPRPVMETNAFTAALLQVANGTAATIAPTILGETFGGTFDLVRLRLVDPDVVKPISLVTSDREPALPAVEALEQTIFAPAP